MLHRPGHRPGLRPPPTPTHRGHTPTTETDLYTALWPVLRVQYGLRGRVLCYYNNVQGSDPCTVVEFTHLSLDCYTCYSLTVVS